MKWKISFNPIKSESNIFSYIKKIIVCKLLLTKVNIIITIQRVNKYYSYKKYFITVIMIVSINISHGNSVILSGYNIYISKINKYVKKVINNY